MGYSDYDYSEDWYNFKDQIDDLNEKILDLVSSSYKKIIKIWEGSDGLASWVDDYDMSLIDIKTDDKKVLKTGILMGGPQKEISKVHKFLKDIGNDIRNYAVSISLIADPDYPDAYLEYVDNETFNVPMDVDAITGAAFKVLFLRTTFKTNGDNVIKKGGAVNLTYDLLDYLHTGKL